MVNFVKSSSDFKKIYAGKKFFTSSFCVHYIITQSNIPTPPCFGFTVSKKSIGKKAVDRNHVKRKLKEAIRLFFPLENFCNYKFVITATKKTKNDHFNEIVNSVNTMPKKILSQA